MKKRISLSVYIVSDATGRTAEAVTRAVLVQFPAIRPTLKRFPGVRRRDQIKEILEEARVAGGIVIYSLVDRELRSFTDGAARLSNVLLIDLLGPPLEKVRQFFELIPLSRPGLLRHVEEASLRVAEAIEFTMRHDDGLGLGSLSEADLVLLGVSRTSKTPTSIYLACNHALKVANVPILPGEKLPEEVVTADIPKIGFTIDPQRLVPIRRARVKATGLAEYTDGDHVRLELDHGLRAFRSLRGIHVINVTQLSIEEIAGKVLEGLKFLR